MPKGWTREDMQDWAEQQYGERESAKEISRVEHQARNDAVGTDFEVRGPEEETTSGSKK